MEDYNSETDSDYTSYWRDWVSGFFLSYLPISNQATIEQRRHAKEKCARKGRNFVVCFEAKRKARHEGSRFNSGSYVAEWQLAENVDDRQNSVTFGIQPIAATRYLAGPC